MRLFFLHHSTHTMYSEEEEDDCEQEQQHHEKNVGASEENSRNILDAYYSHDTPEHFLCDEDIRIPLFPTVVEEASETLRFEFDLDGIVIELRTLIAVKAGLHYLFVGRVVGTNLQEHWHQLKKHIPLTDYSAAGVSALLKTYGHSLGYVDGGYQLNMSCVTAEKKYPHPVFESEMSARANAAQVINAVFAIFAEKLKVLPTEDKQRPTIAKANLNNFLRMNVLRQDKKFVLGVLMDSIEQVNVETTQKILIFISKFGQKDPAPLDVVALDDTTAVESATFHPACTMRAKEPGTSLMWSRYGIHEVVGHRGTIFTACGIAEVANFQTNLDQHIMTVDTKLRDIFNGTAYHTDIHFIQLYATTPHVHGTGHRHPVSRVITTCGLHKENHNRRILRNAEEYVRHMEDLASKTDCPIAARLEAVILTETLVPNVFNVRDYFNIDSLVMLLETTTMLVPFRNNDQGLGLQHVLRPVAEHLSTTMRNMLQCHKGKGGYECSWTAFQTELALEELFFGRTFSPRSRPYSVSLGTSTTNKNSISKVRGFLGLAPVRSSSVGQSPPPLSMWLSDNVQRLRVARVFTFSESLHAVPAVVGDALVLLLLCDLHERNDRINLASLKTTDPPTFMAKLVGCRSTSELSNELIARKGFQYPLTFARALQLMLAHGHDPAECLRLGLQSLKWFPALAFWDEARNPKVKWDKISYVQLHLPTDTPSPAAQAAELTGDVCAMIERKDLSYASTLKRYRENGMPWMAETLRRLPPPLDKQ